MRSHKIGLLLCVLHFCMLMGVSAQAADIASYDQAADRVRAQLTHARGELLELYGNAALQQGPVLIVAGNETLRLGRGPGWLFALRFSEPEQPLYYLAFVRQDARVDVLTAKALPAGLAVVPERGADSGASESVTSREQAYALLLRDLLGHSEQGRRIFAAKAEITATSVSTPTWRGEIALSGGPGWLFFIDDVPAANWAHRCRYVLVSEDGGLHVETASTPPRNMDDFEELTSWPSGSLGAPPAVDAPDLSALKSSPVTPAAHRHAVIISGGWNKYSNYARYWNDCAFFYKTLKLYGFLDENIHVLFADGTDPAVDRPDGTSSPLDFDGDGDPDIQYSATKANIALVFDSLGATLGSEDILYVFATDHGDAGAGNPFPYFSSEVVLCLWGEDITGDELAAEFDKVAPKALAAIFEQCFSGGMVEALAAPNRVIMSASRWWEYSYAMAPYYNYDEFSYHVTTALADPDQGDSNGDNLTTMEEAYLFALAKDVWQSDTLSDGTSNQGEHPGYISEPWNLGRQLSLFGLDTKTDAPVYAGYVQTDTGESFPEPGVAQNWHADDAVWTYELPFVFPFGGRRNTAVSVSSNGVLYFDQGQTSGQTSGKNSVDGLKASFAIAPFWDDLTTAGDYGDIYIEATKRHVTFTWNCVTYIDKRAVNVAVRLYTDGSFTQYYGDGNRLTGRLPQRDKTIGMSDGHDAHFSIVNGKSIIPNPTSIHFQLAAAFVPDCMLFAPPVAGAEAAFVSKSPAASLVSRR